MKSRVVLALLCAGWLAGCTPDAPEPPAPLQFGTPLDARLQEVYTRTCANCHRNEVAGIPQAGNTKHWKIRAARGLDQLTRHAMNGFQGMPPMGFCHECDEADFRALIAYMAGLELPAETAPP